MASTTVYRFRVYCQTEQDFKYIWSDITPTVCPTNAAHPIDSNSITIVDQVGVNQIQIREESIPTGGNFGATCIKFTANPGYNTFVKKFNYPVSALSTTFTTGSAHTGDTINLVAGKDTPIGTILAPVAAFPQWQQQTYSPSDTIYYDGFNYSCINATSDIPSQTNTNWEIVPTKIAVSSTVIENSALGYRIALSDGIHLDRLDEIIAIDKVNNEITMFGASANNYSPASPTYTLLSAYYFYGLYLDLPMTHEIGSKKLGGTHIPANVPLMIEYYNNSSDAKTFVGRVEYIY